MDEQYKHKLACMAAVDVSLMRELGANAFWSLSTCKQGYGISQLRDDNTESYWQSDGPQPHAISLQFERRTVVSVCPDFDQGFIRETGFIVFVFVLGLQAR